MKDEEAAVIEAALAVDELFWPPQGMAGVPIGQVHQTVQALHDAVLRLKQMRRAPVSDS